MNAAIYIAIGLTLGAAIGALGLALLVAGRRDDEAAARERALRQALNDDAHQDRRLRVAITRLRLAEIRAADWLPTDEMREITAAIDGVVDLQRQAPDEATP